MKKLIFLVLALAGIMTSTALAYEDSQIIFEDEFDRASFGWGTSNRDKAYYNITDGYGVVTASNASKAFSQNVNKDISSFMEITLDVKFKVNTMATEGSDSVPLISYSNNNALFKIGIADGKVVCYGMNGATTELGEGLAEGEEYTLKAVRNFGDENMVCTLYNAEGESIEGTTMPITEANAGTLAKILFNVPKGWEIAFDHIIVASTGFDLVSEDIDEKAARTDAEFNLTFSGKIESGYDEIILMDEEGNVVPTTVAVDGGKINIKMPAGLEYDTEYTLVVPGTIISTEKKPFGGKEIEFKTEAAPFKITKVATSNTSGGATATLTYVNNSGLDQTAEVLVLVYEDGVLADMLVEAVTLAAGTTSKTVTLTAAEAYTGTTTVEAYVWTSLGAMQTIN